MYFTGTEDFTLPFSFIFFYQEQYPDHNRQPFYLGLNLLTLLSYLLNCRPSHVLFYIRFKCLKMGPYIMRIYNQHCVLNCFL